MIAHCSFDEPLREGTLQMFFPDQLHMGIDLRNEGELQTNLPFSAIQIGQFLANLRSMLRGLNPSMLGDLAKKRLGYFQNSFEHFLFDDTEMPDDVKPFANAWGSHNCRLIFIERTGHPIAPYIRRFDHTFLPVLMLRNPEGNPAEMLAQLDRRMPSDRPLPEEGTVSTPEPPIPETPIGDL